MEILQLITLILGILIAVFGIIGGLLSLPGSIKRLRKEMRPYGDKGVGFCVVSREDTDRATVYTFLVVEDLFHFLGSMLKLGGKTKIVSIEQVGEYYKVIIEFPSGIDYFIAKTKKEK